MGATAKGVMTVTAGQVIDIFVGGQGGYNGGGSPGSGGPNASGYGGGATDTSDWIFQSTSADNFFIGGVAWLAHGTPDIEPVFSDGNSNDFCRILVPTAGTWIEFYCDGTNWYVNGQAVAATAPAFADT